jgi:cysteine desulfurase
MRIYLDNAATTPMHPDVIKTMLAAMTEDYGNPSSIHRHGRSAKAMVEQARKVVAKLINASIGDVFFTSSATEANNTILKKAYSDLGVTRYIVSPTEHPCVLESISYLRQKSNVNVVFLDVDGQGNISMNHLASVLQEPYAGKTLVSIMHGNNEIGTMSRPKEIGALCKQYHAYYHCDAVQTIVKYPIDVQAMGIHFLSGSGHKFHGPKGIGFMFIDSNAMLTPFIHGGAQERLMRAGTENVAGILGMSKAIDVASINREANYAKILHLRTLLKAGLIQHIDDVRFNGNQDDDFLAHVLSVSFPGTLRADMLVMNLDIAGISVSSASACSAGIEEDSHVLQAIGHPHERKTIRFSISPFNTEEEIAYTITKVKELYK